MPWRVIGAGALALAVLVGLALVPRLVRRRRRERRLGEGPEPVWIELRDTVVDLGLTWPPGRSPRETGAHLVHYFGRPPGTDTESRPRHGADVSPEAERALQRIVATIEQQRYARPGTEQAAILKADAETVIASLQGGVPRATRRRAEWLPRSLFVSQRRPRRSRQRGRRADDLHRRRRPRGLRRFGAVSDRVTGLETGHAVLRKLGPRGAQNPLSSRRRRQRSSMRSMNEPPVWWR